MKQIFRDVRNNFLLTAIVSVLIGLVLVLFPVRTTFMICNIAGILLIVCGIINIIRYVTSKGEAFFIRYDLVVGRGSDSLPRRAVCHHPEPSDHLLHSDDRRHCPADQRNYQSEKGVSSETGRTPKMVG